MNPEHDYEIRRFWKGHYEYTAKCPKCGRRHKLRKWRSVSTSRWLWDLECGSATYKSWSAKELDEMAAQYDHA